MRRKLLLRGYEEKEIIETLEQLKNEDSLNDRRYADLWIEFRLKRKEEGQYRLAEGLRRRGLDRETVNAAVKAAATTEEYTACLLRAREKALKTCEDELEVTDFLVKKGFLLGEIQRLREDFN